MRLLSLFTVACGVVFSSAAVHADWPTYRHDVRRSGVTTESLTLPITMAWVRKSSQPPQAAWTGPAKWDAWAGNDGLQSMRNFDPCFFVTASGGQVFFGSSVDDAVHALDAKTGNENWVKFTGAAVRFPPTLSRGNAYFGSDDGHAYCCDQVTGKEIWRRKAAVDTRPITSNRKIISTWPVRTGVMIQNDKAVFAGSLVPWEPSFLWKVNAATGKVDSTDCFQSKVNGVTLQGALLASRERIYVPQGRAAPLAFKLSSGDSLGAIGEAGGVFCVLTEDEMLIAGPHNQKSKDDQVRVADPKSKRRLATFSGSNRILVSGDNAWVPSGGKLKMLDRAAYMKAQTTINATNAIIKEKKDINGKAKRDLALALTKQTAAWKWEIDCPNPNGFIKAGDTIWVGLDNEVRGIAAKDGTLVASVAVQGTAHGLSVSDGLLLVSTGLGHIYAFESKK